MHRDDQQSGRETSGRGGSCPRCGSFSMRSGPWPWYLGTIGAILCQAVICNECGHEFDLKKPDADLAVRKRNLLLLINGIGFVGILGVIGALVLYAIWLTRR